jgi:PEP-CTERM motif
MSADAGGGGAYTLPMKKLSVGAVKGLRVTWVVPGLQPMGSKHFGMDMISGLRLTRWARLAGMAVAVMGGSSAWAAGTWENSTWNLTDMSNPAPKCTQTAGTNTYYSQSGFGNTLSCPGTDSDKTGMTMSAWGATETANQGFQIAKINGIGSGWIGVVSQYEAKYGTSSPQHATDNSPNGSYVPDMLVLKFDDAVVLNTITSNWYSSDNDISVMAYTGAASSASSIVQGKSASGLGASGGAAAGWGLVQALGDISSSDSATCSSGCGGTTYTFNAGNVASSYWLISAYNSNFGGGYDTVSDFVKFFSVAGKVYSPPSYQVPEPASLGLVVLALAGGLTARRKGWKIGSPA